MEPRRRVSALKTTRLSTAWFLAVSRLPKVLVRAGFLPILWEYTRTIPPVTSDFCGGSWIAVVDSICGGLFVAYSPDPYSWLRASILYVDKYTSAIDNSPLHHGSGYSHSGGRWPTVVPCNYAVSTDFGSGTDTSPHFEKTITAASSSLTGGANCPLTRAVQFTSV